jgi:hypothetical protein
LWIDTQLGHFAAAVAFGAYALFTIHRSLTDHEVRLESLEIETFGSSSAPGGLEKHLERQEEAREIEEEERKDPGVAKRMALDLFDRYWFRRVELQAACAANRPGSKFSR